MELKKYFCTLLIAVCGLLPITAIAQTNLAISKRTFASSDESKSLPTKNVNDGNNKTRWASQYSDDQWVYVDLGYVAKLTKVKLNWYDTYAVHYTIQVSINGSWWSDVYTQIAGDGGVDEISLNTSAQFVRVLMIKRAKPLGYSLWEFEVHGIAPSSASSSSRAAVPVVTSNPFLLEWNIPTLRENGQPLRLNEIGGYVLLGYDAKNQVTFERILLDGSITKYITSVDESKYSSRYSIAAFDRNDLFSNFVTLKGTEQFPQPPAPTGLRLRTVMKVISSSSSSVAK